MDFAAALAARPMSLLEARRFCRLAFATVKALAELRNGSTLDSGPVERAYSALAAFGGRILARLRRRDAVVTVPLLPPAGVDVPLPMMPANVSGLRLADGLQTLALTLNALVAKHNRAQAADVLALAPGQHSWDGVRWNAL